MRSTNELTLLDELLRQSQEQSSLPPDVQFERFAADQALKSYELNDEEIAAGQVDGSGDGGIDSIYIFINSELVADDTKLDAIRLPPQIDIWLIQGRRAASFTETAIDHAIATCPDVFDLNAPIPGLRRRYRPELIDKIELFRDSLISLASRHPHLSIHYIYASRGDASHLSSGVESRASILEKALKTSFADCEVHIEFLGAAELLGRARQHRATNLGLRFIEQPIAPDQDGYIVLVKIADYYRFISESDSLRRYIFESNVREYQGNNEVNSEIARTLKSKDLKPDFWWLNNGVTIIASHASVTGKTLWLENPQIVNGLQTSENVFTYFQGRPSNGNAAADERAVLAKVVVTSEPALRDRIIKATNSQTPLPSWSLRATDPIQRDIEDYFRTVGLYYDRRKNSYRYVEPPVPLERVISIPYLAQAVMAIALARPNDARARPTSIINRDTDYATVFDAARPLETYHVCARLMREVEMYLEGRVQAGELSSHQRDNFRFHFAWMMIVALFGRKGFGIQELTKLSKIHISDHITLADRTLVKMLEVLASFQRTHADWDVARIAKSGDFQRLLNSSFRPRRSSAVVQ